MASTMGQGRAQDNGQGSGQTGGRDIGQGQDDDYTTYQSQPLPKDAFKLRALRKARAAGSVQTGVASYGSLQTGSASYGSGFSGEQSGSYG